MSSAQRDPCVSGCICLQIANGLTGGPREFFDFERTLMVARTSLLAGLLVFLAPGVEQVQGQALRGSEASVTRAYDGAGDHDFTFLRTAAQVQRFVDAGYLVRIGNSRDFMLHDVSFPYGRPEVKLFIQRLGGQYHRACGEELVVTSLTRTSSEQPRNASIYSVHPTGMAVDFRTSSNSVCRNWLESTLLYLETAGCGRVSRTLCGLRERHVGVR